MLRAVNIRTGNSIGIGLRVRHHLKPAMVADHRFRGDRDLLRPHPRGQVSNCGHHLALSTLKALHISHIPDGKFLPILKSLVLFLLLFHQ